MKQLILKSGDGKDEFIEIRLTPSSFLEKAKTTYHIPPVRVSHKAWEEHFKAKANKEAFKKLKGASWVWSNFRLTKEEARYGGLVTYYKYFYIPQNSRILEYSISITADDVYKLYINGEEVGYSNDWGRVDTFNKEHPTYIHPGKNYLIVTAFNTPHPQAQQHEHNPAGIIFSGIIRYKREGRLVRWFKKLFKISPKRIAISVGLIVAAFVLSGFGLLDVGTIIAGLIMTLFVTYVLPSSRK